MTIPIDRISSYHVHVYYSDDTKSVAEVLRGGMIVEFTGAEFGHWHDKPVGPHPDGSFQIAFRPELFHDIMAYLTLNRNGLTILIHPNTGEDLLDHRDRAMWMGEVRPLDLNIF